MWVVIVRTSLPRPGSGKPMPPALYEVTGPFPSKEAAMEHAISLPEMAHVAEVAAPVDPDEAEARRRQQESMDW